MNIPKLVAEFEREHKIFGWYTSDGVNYHRGKRREVDYREFVNWLIKKT